MQKKAFIILLFVLCLNKVNAQLIGELNNNNRGTLRVVGSNKIKQDCNLGDIIEAVFFY